MRAARPAKTDRRNTGNSGGESNNGRIRLDQGPGREKGFVRRTRAGPLRLHRRGRPQFRGDRRARRRRWWSMPRPPPQWPSDVQARIATVTDRPVRQVVLSHYHAVRVLGASGYPGPFILCSDVTRDLIAERGQQDMDSEIGRFPRLFRGREGIPGLTWPTHTFHGRMTLWLGEREAQADPHRPRPHGGRYRRMAAEREGAVRRRYGGVRRHPLLRRRLFHRLARHHRPAARTRRRKNGARPRPRAAERASEVADALDGTEAFTASLFALVRDGGGQGRRPEGDLRRGDGEARPRFGHWVIFDHCMPFNVSRAFDKASGIDRPRIWTAARDRRDVAGARKPKRAEWGDRPLAAEQAMQSTLVHPHYDHMPPTNDGARHPVVVVGGGMVGLTAALDLALRGQPVVLLDDDDTVSRGSRAICFAKRTLEMYARLGLGARRLPRASPGTSAACSSATAASTSSTCWPNRATNTRPSSTCSNTTWSNGWWRRARPPGWSICAGATGWPGWKTAPTGGARHRGPGRRGAVTA